MDGLIVILIILYFVSRNSKKKGKNTSKGKKNAFSQTLKQVGREGLKEAGSFIDTIAEAFEGDDAAPKAVSRRKDIKAGKQAQDVKSARESAAVFEQESFIDAQGCVGGSLPHVQHEGEARHEHSEHVRRVREAEKESLEAAEIAKELQAMNLRQLRRAVVVSEILGKPKALQRRG